MKSNILDVTYFVTFVQRNFGNMQVFLPLEVFEPENGVSAIDFHSQGVRVKQSNREFLAQLHIERHVLFCVVVAQKGT